MLNPFSTKTKSGKRITVQVSAPRKLDTGRKSSRNNIVARQEAYRSKFAHYHKVNQ